MKFQDDIKKGSKILKKGNKAKRKNMCVSCYISKKIRVGRSLLIFFLF